MLVPSISKIGWRTVESLYVIDSNGCWIWQAFTRDSGYGHYHFEGKNQLAHRIFWKIFKGEIPAGKLVCHTCDNPSCVNPDHLFLGSDKDNVHDMMIKGRSRFGPLHLSLEKVEEIRLASGSVEELASKFKVQRKTVREIKTGKRWSILSGDVTPLNRSKRGRLTKSLILSVRDFEGSTAQIAEKFNIYTKTVRKIKKMTDEEIETYV